MRSLLSISHLQKTITVEPMWNWQDASLIILLLLAIPITFC